MSELEQIKAENDAIKAVINAVGESAEKLAFAAWKEVYEGKKDV
jgi:hypothetical protein